ncbi:hypothetical protein [Ancylomarina sp.]|uniref:hypothetical protein n=1 Tax=Ancylomarina sp. TaxID=1970196 RepID=UPI0035655795
MIKKVIPISLFTLLFAKIIYNLITDLDTLNGTRLLGMGLRLFVTSYIPLMIYIDFLDGFKIKQIKKE